MKLEIKDSKDIIYDNYKIHHKKLGKDIRPKKHDIKKYVALDDILDIDEKEYNLQTLKLLLRALKNDKTNGDK